MINTNFLPFHDHTRSGIYLPRVRGVVFHYPQAPGWTAEDLRSYFANLPKTEPNKFASYHYIVGLTGDVMQIIPENECAWHAGPSGDTYPEVEDLLGGKPNWRTIGICMCHPRGADQFTEATREVAIELGAMILRQHKADIILRHHDCTGKHCPAWFVNHPGDWDSFENAIRDLV